MNRELTTKEILREKTARGDRLVEGVYLGTEANLIQKMTVGSWSTVGAGAVAVDNTPPNVVAAGVPARVAANREGSQ